MLYWRRAAIGLLLCTSVSFGQSPEQIPRPPIGPKKAEPVRTFLRGPFTEGSGPHVVNFSPDGSLLIGHSVGPAYLWDAKTGKLIREFGVGWGHGGTPLDSKRVAALSRRPAQQIIVYEIETGQQLVQWNLPDNQSIRQVIAADDGERLITDAGTITVWKTRNGDEVARFANVLPPPAPEPWRRDNLTPPAPPPGRTVTLMDDQKRLRVADGAGKWVELDIETGEFNEQDIRKIPPGTVSFSRDGKVLAILSEGDVSFIDPATGKGIDLALPKVGDISALYLAATLSPDGKLLAAQQGRRVFVFDLTAKPVKLLHDFPVSNVPEYPHKFVWAPDNERLLVMGERWVDDWNIKTGKPTFTDQPHEGNVFGLDFSPEKKELLSCDSRGRIVRRSFDDGRILATRPDPEGPPDEMGMFHAWFKGDAILTNNLGGWFSWLDPETLKTKHEARIFPVRTGVFAVARDASVIAALKQDSQIELYDGKTLTKTETIAPAAPGVVSMTFSADAKTLVQATPTSIYLVDLAKKKQRVLTLGPSRKGESMRVIQYSPDNRYLFARGTMGIAAWNLEERGEPGTPVWITHLPGIYLPYFSVSESWVIVPQENAVRIYERETGQEICALDIPVRAQPVVHVPGTTKLLISGPPRFLALYDIQSILYDPIADELKAASSTDLWSRSGLGAAEAYPAVMELSRRGELAARTESWLEKTKKQRDVAEKVRAAIARLNAADPAEVEKAHLELERMGPSIIPEATAAHAKATGETQQRLAALLRAWEHLPAPPTLTSTSTERLVRIRAVLKVTPKLSAEDEALLKQLMEISVPAPSAAPAAGAEPGQ